MSVGRNVLSGGALVLAGAYATSYCWEQVSRPEARQAQNQIKELKKLLAEPTLDEPELLQLLQQIVRASTLADKRELERHIHLFVAMCAAKNDAKYSATVVSAALDVIRCICRQGKSAMAALCAAGGVKVLFVALTRAYTTSMTATEGSAAAKDLVEKLLGVIEEVVSFDESLVALDFDEPEEAAAAKQLASLKALSSMTMLLRPEHGFAHKRTKVLGIISAVTAIRAGAVRITTPTSSTDSGLECVDQLLYFAAKSDSKPQDYAKATQCVANLVRHVPAARARVLSTEPGLPGLANIPRLRDQFLEIIDGGAIGYPPRTQQTGRPREPSAVAAGLDALIALLEHADSRAAANEAMVDANQRGVLAILGILCRCENRALRAKAAALLGPGRLSEDVARYAEAMLGYTGTGENAEKWGTGFRVAMERRLREQKDMQEKSQHQRKMQQQQMMMQQQMMQAGASPEDLMGMMGGAGGMSPEMMEMMMGGGMQ